MNARKNVSHRWILCSGVLLLLLALSMIPFSDPAQAQDKKPQINFLLCPMGCGSIEGNQMLGTVIAKRNLPFLLNAQETPGYIYNLREIAKNQPMWKNTIFSTEDDVVAIAEHGGEPFVKDFWPEKITNKWKILYGEGVCTAGHAFLTLNPKIKSVADLKGKRIGLGLRTQSCWGMNAAVNLWAGYGITAQNTKFYYLGPAKATEELLNGKVDAIMSGFNTNYNQTTFNLPGNLRVLDASGREIYYLTPGPEVFDKVNKKLGSFTQVIQIKAGVLPKQKKALTIGGDRTFNVADSSFPEELAYQMVKAVATVGPELKTSHSYWTIVTDLDMVNGLSEENTHPGAIRAFKELGLWDLRKKFKPTEVAAFK